MRNSFNPCSFGCQSESPCDHGRPPGIEHVSILVLLDVSLKVTLDLDHFPPLIRVSILVLLDVSLKVTLDLDHFPPLIRVSILVLLDVSLKESARRGSQGRPPVSILVLLDVSLKECRDALC